MSGQLWAKPKYKKCPKCGTEFDADHYGRRCPSCGYKGLFDTIKSVFSKITSLGKSEDQKVIEKWYQQYLKDTTPTSKEKLSAVLTEMVSSSKKRWKGFKEKPEVNWFVRFILPLFVVLQAFFPSFIFGLGVGFIVVLIIVIVVIVIVVAYTSGGIGILGGSLIIDIILPIVSIVAIFVVTQLIGTPDYFARAAKIPGGSFTVNILFLAACGFVGFLILLCKRIESLTAGTAILYAMLFFIIPFGITYSKPYSLCMKIPGISQYCNPIEVTVQPPEIVIVPVSGGVDLTYGAPDVGVPARTLYAGEPYEYTFTFRNYYSVPITFKLNTSIISTYGTHLKFYVNSFKQRINKLNASQFYQDGVLADPAQMVVEPIDGCPYYLWQINKTQNIPAEEIECAKDKPCESYDKACTKTDYMECKCAGWVEATCSGARVYLLTEVEHTGYFLGAANIYYSSINEPPQPAYQLKQGPLSVTVEFQPNPYIGPIHYYRNDTSMYVTFKNTGGDITITSFNVKPLVTNITTVDKEKKKMLVETVGIDKKECRESELIGRKIPSGEEYSMLLCKLSPPYVHTELIDLDTGEVVEINNVTFDRILHYCKKIKVQNQTTENGTIFWSSYWGKIYESIEESGLCEVLENESKIESEIVSNALKFTTVKIEFNYIRKNDFSSSFITPYTRTEECIKLKELQSVID